MIPACNICSANEFVEYRGRAGEQCANCGAKARHRIGLEVYKRHLFPLAEERPNGRILHMAPEAALYEILKDRLGGRYLTSDAAPERYPHAPCLKLFFPQDFDLFPEGYFTAILHNHVLEHIPGHYGDHLEEFTRLLEPGGRMIISVPGPYKGIPTREGGEHLATDAERLEQFLQGDHYKLLGDDFVPSLEALRGGHLIDMGISDEQRAALSVRPGKAPFFIWQRD